MFLADRNGRIVMSDELTASLLALASEQPIRDSASLPCWLCTLIYDGKTDAHDSAQAVHVIERQNGAGRFVFRGYRLQSPHEHGDRGLFAISIEHHLSMAETVGAVAGKYGLSERQRGVCVQMLGGASYAEIGRELGIKESTVVDHVRRIYEKLKISSRDELKSKLL